MSQKNAGTGAFIVPSAVTVDGPMTVGAARTANRSRRRMNRDLSHSCSVPDAVWLRPDPQGADPHYTASGAGTLHATETQAEGATPSTSDTAPG